MNVRRYLVLAALSVVTFAGACVDAERSPTGDRPLARAAVAIVPRITGGAMSTAATAGEITRIRITARLQSDGTVLNTVTQDVDPNANEWAIVVEIPIPAGGGATVLTIELMSVEGNQETVEFSGQTQPIPLNAGTPTQANVVPVGRGPIANIGVTSVVIEPAGDTIVIGGATEVAATALPANPQNPPTIFFVSVNPSIATVDDDGAVTGVAEGTTGIVASAGQHADTSTIVVRRGVADLSVLKRLTDDERETFNEGETVSYTVVVENDGPRSATQVQVEDVMDAGLTIVGSEVTSGIFDANSGVWVIDELAAGEADTLIVQAIIGEGTVDQTLWNRARHLGLALQIDTVPSNDADSVAVGVVPPEADVEVTKELVDGADYFEGHTVEFLITVENKGPGVATGVAVLDDMDGGLTLSESDASRGDFDGATGTWTIGPLEEGATETLRLRAVVDPGTAGEELWNRARSEGLADQVDLDASNDADSVSVQVQHIEADIKVEKELADDGATYREGDTVEFVVKVENAGPATATNVRILEDASAGLTIVSASPDAGTFDESEELWTLNSLVAGESAEMTVVALVGSGTVGQTLSNSVRSLGLAAQIDTDADNDEATASLEVQEFQTDVGVTVTFDKVMPFAFDTLQVTTVVENHGPGVATNVVITPTSDTIKTTGPASVVTTAGSLDPSGEWLLPSIPAGATETLTAKLHLSNLNVVGDTLRLSVAITALDEVDTNPANDADSAFFVLQEKTADVSVTKTVDNASPLQGDQITYTVTVDNNGPNDVTALDVLDSLGISQTYVSHAASAGAFVSGTGAWSIGTLANGATATLDLTVQVDSGTVGSTLTNFARVVGFTGAAEIDPVNDSATATVDVTEPGPLTLTWVGGFGGDPTRWDIAANWNPIAVPRPQDDVTIPAGPAGPVLAGPVTVNDVTVADGTTLDLNGFDLTAVGSVAAGNTISGSGTVIMTGSGTTLSGTLPSVSIRSVVTVAGPTTFTGPSDITTAGRLEIVDASTLTLDDDLTVDVGAASGFGLAMSHPTAEVISNGTLTFAAVGPTPSTAVLTLGTIKVRGDFVQTQNAGATGVAFAPSGGVVVFDGLDPVNVSFQSPGPTDSRFSSVSVYAAANVTFTSSANTTSNLNLSGAVTVASGTTLAVGGTLNLNSSGVLGVDGTVTGTCSDAGGTITGVGSHPCSGAQQFDKVWLGATTDWSSATNWSPTGVPTSTEDIFVRAAAPNQPTMTADGSVRDIKVEATATVTQAGFTLDVHRDAEVYGAITGGDTDLVGGSSVLFGVFDNLIVSTTRSASGTVNLAGDLTVNGQPFDVLNRFVSVAGDVTVSGGGGRLVMNTTGGVVDVEGNATFDGASHSGYLTNGTLRVAGDFTANATNSTQSFRGTGSHTTVFDGTASQTVTFSNPGLSNQQFHNVTFDNPTVSTIVLASDIAVVGAASVLQGAIDGSSSTMWLSGSLSDPAGGLTIQTLRVTAGVTAVPAALTTDLIADVSWTLPNDLALTGNLTTYGTLTVNTRTLSVSGTLDVLGSGRLYMAYAADVVDVEGAVTFNGTNHNGYLVQGVLRIAGDFTATGHAEAFLASTSHTTEFDGTSPQTVSFSNPGPTGGNVHRFQNVTFKNTTATTTLASDMPVSGALTVLTGAVVDGATRTVYVAGSFTDPDPGMTMANLRLRGDVSALPASITADVYVDATVYLPNTTSITGSISTTSLFDISGFTLSASGDLSVTGSSGRLVMDESGSEVDIEGDALFDGADHNGYFTIGTLRLAGNLTANATHSTRSFYPTPGGATWVYLDGSAAQTVDFSSASATEQQFAKLVIENTDVTFNDDIYVSSIFWSNAQASTLSGGGNTLFITGTFDIQTATFDNLRVNVNSTLAPSGFAFNDNTFQNMATTVTQFYVRMQGSTVSWDDNTFSTVPTTGKYMELQSENAVFVNVELWGSSPADGSAYEAEGANAEIEWEAELNIQQQQQPPPQEPIEPERR